MLLARDHGQDQGQSGDDVEGAVLILTEGGSHRFFERQMVSVLKLFSVLTFSCPARRTRALVPLLQGSERFVHSVSRRHSANRVFSAALASGRQQLEQGGPISPNPAVHLEMMAQASISYVLSLCVILGRTFQKRQVDVSAAHFSSRGWLLRNPLREYLK